NGPRSSGADGVFVQTRGNGDRVRVLANTSPVFVNGVAPNRVEVGDSGRLTDIFRDVIVLPTSVATDLVSDNSADTTGRTVTITDTTIAYGNPNALLRYTNLSSLQVKGGAGGSTYTVTATPDAPGGVLLETRGNADRVGVLANATPLTIAGFAPNRVEVGANGRLSNIFRDVIVSNQVGATELVSDDSADPTGRIVTITNTTV